LDGIENTISTPSSIYRKEDLYATYIMILLKNIVANMAKEKEKLVSTIIQGSTSEQSLYLFMFILSLT